MGSLGHDAVWEEKDDWTVIGVVAVGIVIGVGALLHSVGVECIRRGRISRNVQPLVVV